MHVLINVETVLEALARGHTAQKRARRDGAATASTSPQSHLVHIFKSNVAI